MVEFLKRSRRVPQRIAARGLHGHFYIGTARAYEEGGYEASPGATNVAPEVEPVLLKGIEKLLADR